MSSSGPKQARAAALHPARGAWSWCASLALVAAACGSGAAHEARTAAAAAVFAPLPPEGFRVEWSPVLLPTTLRPGEARRVAVRVTNAGPVAWPADGHPRRYCIRLSHRWLRGVDGLEEVGYVDRVDLPAPLAPGASATLEATVTAPSKPGDYVVQFDLIQAAVGWFSPRGGARKLVLVKVQ